MNEQSHDPALTSLFEAPQKLSETEFSGSVMREVTKHRYRQMTLRVLPAIVFAPLAPFTQASAIQLVELLMTSLVNIEGELLAQLLAPINTVAGALSVSILALRVIYQRVFLLGN